MRLAQADARQLAGRIVSADELNDFRRAISPVTDAIVRGRSPARIERLATRTAGVVWNAGLADAAERALDALQDSATRTLEQVEQARAELLRPPHDNRLGRYLILSLGLRCAHEARRVRGMVELVEAELRDAPLHLHPTVGLRGAGRVIALRGDVPRLELMAAAARVQGSLPSDPEAQLDAIDDAARTLARLVATDDRRQASRKAAHDLLRFACDGLPLLSRTLEGELAEDAPESPEDDLLWISTVLGALGLVAAS
jgi:hypothetical protein